MKTRILGLIFWLVFMAVYPAQAAFEGFRIGGMLGIQLLAGRHWYTGTHSPDTDMVKRLGGVSSLYGIHAGYLAELGQSKVVVGAEVYGFIPQANPKIDLALLGRSTEGSVTINHTRSIGVVGTAGMMLNPKVLAYVSAGMELAKFQFKYTFQNTLPGIGSLPASQTLNHTFKAINVALGGTYKVGSHFLVGLEISAPFFKRFKARSGPDRAYHYKPVERRAMMKLTYLF